MRVSRKTRPAPLLKPGVPPPPDYYRNNLLRVLEHVGEHCADLLAPTESAFIARVRAASPDAQRLYARLIGRTIPRIRVDKLAYREVRDLDAAIDELAAAGLIELGTDAPAEDLLKLFTRNELETLFEVRAPTRRAPTKKALLEVISGRHPYIAIRDRLCEHSGWLCLADRHCLDLVQLLFFGGPAMGGPRADLTTFVLEDLGAARFEDYVVGRSRRLFRDREELLRYLALRDLNELSHGVAEHFGLADAVLVALARIRHQPPAADADALALRGRAPSSRFDVLSSTPASSSGPRDQAGRRLDALTTKVGDGCGLASLPNAATRLEGRVRDRILNRLGHWFERTGCERDALGCYVRSSSHPARERRVRILSRIGETAAAHALQDEMARDPQTPEEQDFAARFGNGRTRTMPPVTVVEMGTMQGEVNDTVERLALRWFEEQGGEGWHLENRLPLGLAGLAFWDVVFAPVDGAFLNPYQAGPLDLFWEDFAVQRRAALAQAKAALRCPERFVRILTATLEAKAGIVNSLVSWRHLDAHRLSRVLEAVPHAVLFPLVCHVIDNLRMVRTGFPDLLVLYGAGGYEFVEVKGPHDRLQPAQRMWFEHFRESGCNARILKFKCSSTGPGNS